MLGGYACCSGTYACTSDGPANECRGRGIVPGYEHWLCSDNFWFECGPDAVEETVHHGASDFLCAGASTWHQCSSANAAATVVAAGREWICADGATWEGCTVQDRTVTANGTTYHCCFNIWDELPCGT